MTKCENISLSQDCAKKVLLIAYYYYQDESPASKRTKGLCKYLPEFGWDVTLITPQPSDTTTDTKNIRHVHIRKSSLRSTILHSSASNNLNFVHRDTKDTGNDNKHSSVVSIQKSVIHKISSILSNKHVRPILSKIYQKLHLNLHLSEEHLWENEAIRISYNILQKTQYDAILSTQCPMSAHEIAMELKLKTNLPWVADYRDLFSQWSLIHSKESEKQQKENYCYECDLIKSADYLTVVSEPWAKELSKQHNKPVSVIPNGFDPDIIASSVTLSKKFTIMHSGVIYGRKRTLKPLFASIHELIDENLIDGDNIELNFYGPLEDEFWNDVHTYSLENCVKFHGIVSHDKILQLQRESQILLLLTADDPIDVGCYPAKVFEYLAAVRPILSYGYPHECVISSLLNETQTGIHATTNDEIKTQLLTWYNEYKMNGKVMYGGDADMINTYSHRGMAEKFARVLNTVSNS